MRDTATPPHIMVVDDDRDLLRLIEQMLNASSYRATTLDDPLRFEQVFDAASPDAVVLDIVMPGRDGIEIIQGMAERAPDTPIVIMSGFGPTYTMAATTLVGIYGDRPVVSLRKPFARRTLLDALDQCLLADARRGHAATIDRARVAG